MHLQPFCRGIRHISPHKLKLELSPHDYLCGLENLQFKFAMLNWFRHSYAYISYSFYSILLTRRHHCIIAKEYSFYGGTDRPTANTVRATDDFSPMCFWSKRFGSNIPSQMIGAFQDVDVWTAGLALD